MRARVAAVCVTGVDITPNLLEQARQRAAAEKLDAVFYEGAAEQLSYDDCVFTSRTVVWLMNLSPT